jgi:hypothetical protein
MRIRNGDTDLEKCCLHFSKTEGVEHETDYVDCDNWEEFLRSRPIPSWDLYSIGEDSGDMKEEDCDDELKK